jgi:hypothetical protein
VSDKVYRLRVLAPADGWLTSNPRRAGAWRARSAVVREWRSNAAAACMAAGLPKGITPVTIEVVAWYRGRAPVNDRLNLAPTIKAAVDGLGPERIITRNGKRFHAAGYGLLTDDSDRHVRDTTWTMRKAETDVEVLALRGAVGALVFTITHHREQVAS